MLVKFVGVSVIAGGIAAVALSSTQQSTDGKLAARYTEPDSARIGTTRLKAVNGRGGFIHVPPGNSSTSPAPLLIMLHGATGSARPIESLIPHAEAQGVALLVPESRGMTWDAVRGDWGPDVTFIDSALVRTFRLAHIDRCRIVVGGFSDGASYALSIGVRNAGLLSGITAFSPGFIIPMRNPGKMPVFIRHGTRDQILNIDATSRRIQRDLKSQGYVLDYQEFDGPHTIRQEDVQTGMQWIRALPSCTGSK